MVSRRQGPSCKTCSSGSINCQTGHWPTAGGLGVLAAATQPSTLHKSHGRDTARVAAAETTRSPAPSQGAQPRYVAAPRPSRSRPARRRAGHPRRPGPRVGDASYSAAAADARLFLWTGRAALSGAVREAPRHSCA